jgi:hypothetical protein
MSHRRFGNRSASETLRRVYREFVKNIKKDWDAFIESAGYLFFGRLSYDHVRLDDWRKYFTDIIPCSAGKGGWMYGTFAHPSGRVYASTDMGNLFRSDDGGKTFVAVGQNDFYDHVFHIAINPNNPDHIIISSTAGIFVSYDGGVTTKRGRLSVGKYLEHGALGDQGAFRALRDAPSSMRGGDPSAWEFTGWGQFDDYTNWTNDKWLGKAGSHSNNDVSRIEAFGSIFSQDLFFSGYKTISSINSYRSDNPTNNQTTAQNYIPAGRQGKFGNLWRDSVYYNSNSRMVYRNTNNQYQNSNSFDIPFSNQVQPDFAEGRVAYRRRGRPIAESTSNPNASNIADLIFTSNSLSSPFHRNYINYSMFVKAAFAPSNPDIVYAISGYSPRSFIKFGIGDYSDLMNINYNGVHIPADSDPNRSLTDRMLWWSLSFIWVSFDGGESWNLLGHTVGMWRPPRDPIPNWWKDLFQNYSSPPTFTRNGLPNVDKKITTVGTANNVLGSPYWHLVNNALSEGNDLRLDFSWSGSAAEGNWYAPGIMMIDLAVDPNNPFVVMLSCNDMFASFTYGSTVSFSPTDPTAITHRPQRTLRPYWTGGLIRIEIKTINLVDPRNSNFPITEVGTNPSNSLGLISRIYTGELCSINSDYTWYSSKARYTRDLGTNRRPINQDGWFNNRDLHDVIVESNTIEWKQSVYETNRTVGQTYLMRTVKRGYSQTAAMIAFDWTLNDSLTASWASNVQDNFIHNGILALIWKSDGLWVTQIPRWRLLKDASGNPATYRLSSDTSRTYYIFECSPMIAKLNFDGKTLSSITPVRSYHQETYRIRPNTNDWQSYLSAYGISDSNNTFTSTNIENAPHRAMKYLYAILGHSDSFYQQSLHNLESDYIPVIELPSYFVNYWAWETFTTLELQHINENKFVRYKNIFNSTVSNYDGKNLGNNIPFYSLMPLNVNIYALYSHGSLIIFPIAFLIDDYYIFVGQNPRRSSDFLQRSYTKGNPHSLAVLSRRNAPFLILDRSSPKGCFVAIESKANANASATNQTLNALVYLKDRLSPPFPYPVFYNSTKHHSIPHNDFIPFDENTQDGTSYQGSSFIKEHPRKYVLLFDQGSRSFRYEIDFENKTCFVNKLESSPNTSYSKNSKYPLLSSLPSETRTIFLTNYKKLNQLGSTYLNQVHSLITSDFNSQADSALHIWEKCSGFEETANLQTRWLKEPNAIAYWDEHQCNAIVLAEKSAFYNRLVERLLHWFSVAKTHNSNREVEGSNTEIAYQTFRSGLTVLGDDSEFVYYAFQYYLPRNQPSNGYFVGVLRISKELLLRPESLGDWFDGLHPLGFLKHDEGGWYWSRDINKHIQILTPVGRIRRLDWAQSDPNAKHYLPSPTDMGPNDFDMGAASIMPCMIFGRNDSSIGYVYGQVVEDGDDTIIYLHVGNQTDGHATNQTQAQNMVAPSTNNYSFAQSNRKAFIVDNNNNPVYDRDYGQMYNPKIYRLKVSRSRVYTGWMYTLPPHPDSGRRYIQFDFANPFDGSLECLNDDTYYELTYHPDVLHSETVEGETKFYLDPNNNPHHLTRWSNERWGYWYRHDNTNNANLIGIRHGGDTSFRIARFSKIDTPRARLYTHVFAVHYKVNNSNNQPYPDFSDIRQGWVEWDVPGFLWDNLGGCTNFGRSFVVDPFNKGEKNRLLVSAQIAFPTGMNVRVTSSDPLGLYPTGTTSITWCTVLFDVRREIVDGKPVWKWYALFPNGLLYFSAPFYRSNLPNLPSGTQRFEINMTLSPQQYADTVCYNWLEENDFKIKVNPSPINIGTGAVDLMGRYRLGNSGNYSAVSFVSFPYGYLPFTLRRTSRSPSLTIEAPREVETPAGTMKEIGVYMGSSSDDLSLESIWMFNTTSFNVMPSPLAFRILGNLSTTTDANSVAERIRILGEALFSTRDFKPNGYYHTLAKYLSTHNSNTLRQMLNPMGAVIRFTIKDVPEYNLLRNSSPVNYIPIDPVRTPSSNRISILDNFRIILEHSIPTFWQGVLVHYTNGVLFAAYPIRSGEPIAPYQNHLFMSVNRGESWVAVKIPFISNGFTALDIHPQTFDFIICGSAYPMVFRSVGYREFVRRLMRSSGGFDKLPLRRYELAGRKRL